jgi:hypothetical protein
MQYPPRASMIPEMSQRGWFEEMQAQLHNKGIQVMLSCSLYFQAVETENVEEATKLSTTCDRLMAEYETLNESLVEMLRRERDWVAILAECFLSQTPPPARPRFSTPGMRALINAAPEVALKEEELPTEITDGRQSLTLEWYPNSCCRRARVVVILPMGNPCAQCLVEPFFIDRLTTVQVSIDVAKTFVA